jgi:2-amino-4-hydroxy-6-hydroxymethyldihydropteridine diphosphokinase
MGNTLAMIALGSNLGDRKATLDRAIADLIAAPGIVVRKVSTYLETSPVGGPGGQRAFLNAAAALESTLDPFALHRLLVDIERRAGRIREIRWDSRTLDLDLILFGDQFVDTPHLIVPHPRYAVRRFVLAPMVEISPEVIDPLTGKSVEDLLFSLARRPSYVAIDGPPGTDFPHRIAQRVSEVLGGVSQFRQELRPSASEGNPLQWFDQFVSSKEALRESRDLALSMPGDRWMITDFCLDVDLIRLSGITTKIKIEQTGSAHVNEMDRRLEVVAQPCSDTVSPTFLVAIGFRDWEWGLPLLAKSIGVPTLIPDATDDDGLVSEIVAACQATRP